MNRKPVYYGDVFQSSYTNFTVATSVNETNNDPFINNHVHQCTENAGHLSFLVYKWINTP